MVQGESRALLRKCLATLRNARGEKFVRFWPPSVLLWAIRNATKNTHFNIERFGNFSHAASLAKSAKRCSRQRLLLPQS